MLIQRKHEINFCDCLPCNQLQGKFKNPLPGDNGSENFEST